MSVRAKMRCIEVADTAQHSDGAVVTKRVRLQPVYGTEQDKANAEWSRWTPSGQLELTITNPDAYEQFKVGRLYFVDCAEIPEG